VDNVQRNLSRLLWASVLITGRLLWASVLITGLMNCYDEESIIILVNIENEHFISGNLLTFHEAPLQFLRNLKNYLEKKLFGVSGG